MSNNEQQEEKQQYTMLNDQDKPNMVVILTAALNDMKAYQSDAATYKKIQNIMNHIQNGIILSQAVLASNFVPGVRQWRVGNGALFVSFIPYGQER